MAQSFNRSRRLYLAAYDISCPRRPRTVPLAMLQRLVIQGRARLDTNLLAALGEHGVDVLLLGARHGRRRRPPPDPVNACLSLGYTLLHNEALQACHIAGLDPLIGFYHQPAYGRESLACDLIEPLRPRLDRWVWWLFRERVVRSEGFVYSEGGCRLNKATRQPYFASYEVAARRWRRYLRLQAYRLATTIMTLAPNLPGSEEQAQ